MLKHVHPTLNVFLENVRPDGSFLPGWEGRLLNPGHSIEAAWFLLVYAQNRQNKELIEKSLLLMERSFELGWNKKNGGIIYFVDIEGFSPV
jgi:N-acylglucosamine 2-epimerase